MGNSPFRRLFGKKEVRIFILGPDSAGKTTTMYNMKFGKVVSTTPTIEFNVETLQFKNRNVTLWDVGGGFKRGSLYRKYYQHAQGLVYVLDSNDKDRLEEALQELFTVVKEDEPRTVPILVLANKQDRIGATKPEDIATRLHNEQCMRHTRWNVFGVCAVHGTNNELFEAFDWLVNEVVGTEKIK